MVVFAQQFKDGNHLLNRSWADTDPHEESNHFPQMRPVSSRKGKSSSKAYVSFHDRREGSETSIPSCQSQTSKVHTPKASHTQIRKFTMIVFQLLLYVRESIIRIYELDVVGTILGFHLALLKVDHCVKSD